MYSGMVCTVVGAGGALLIQVGQIPLPQAPCVTATDRQLIAWIELVILSTNPNSGC